MATSKSIIEWTFRDSDKTSTTQVNEDGGEIFFHPMFSSGTAVIRGHHQLQKNYHHYWELEMKSPIYGTDVMVGIGTANASYNSHTTTFASVIGIDKESWGYSYQGYLHHDQSSNPDRPKKYTVKKNWKEGSIIGIYYNAWNGSLEFYVNRTPLGVAFTNIPKDKAVFPMMSSTAAKSKMKLICAQKFKSSLAFECAKVLCKPKSSSYTEPYLTYAVPFLLYAKNNKYQWNLLMNTKELAKWTQKLPPGLWRYINDNCWFLIGCKLQDLKSTTDQPAKEVNDSCVIVSSSEDEDISFKTKRKSELQKPQTDSSDSGTEDESFGHFRSVGPGPSVPRAISTGSPHFLETSFSTESDDDEFFHQSKKKVSGKRLRLKKSSSEIQPNCSSSKATEATTSRQSTRYNLRKRKKVK